MSKRKLLLADDSVTIQKVVNLTFADEGIEVITTGDGDSAMEKMRDAAPDLVMADVNMPGLSGYEICERIKQNEETRQTPVILLVGSFEPFDEEKAHAVGADAFLTKPFQSIRQLVTKVTSLLDYTPEQSGYDTFSDTVKIETEDADEQGFEDSAAANDDELIETVSADDYGQDPGRPEDAEPADDFSQPQTFTEDDVREFESADSPEQVTYEAAHYESPAERSEFERAEEASAAEDDFSGGADDSGSEEEIIYNAAEESASGSSEYGDYDRTYSYSTDEESTEESSSADEESESAPYRLPPSILEFDDSDLLDLPPVEEQASPSDSVQPPAEPAPEASPAAELSGEFEEENIKETVSAQFSAADFPPEVIEAIADKVVEKLSQKLKE